MVEQPANFPLEYPVTPTQPPEFDHSLREESAVEGGEIASQRNSDSAPLVATQEEAVLPSAVDAAQGQPLSIGEDVASPSAGNTQGPEELAGMAIIARQSAGSADSNAKNTYLSQRIWGQK